MALNKLFKFIRKNIEFILSIFVFLTIIHFRLEISEKFVKNLWNLDTLYSSVFDWSSIQSAFLFSIYAFFLSRSEPFIQAVSKTQPFKMLRRYVLRSLWLSLGLTIITLPLAVSPPEITSSRALDWGFLVFLFVSVLMTYTFMCFVKVIRVFRKLEGVDAS